MHLLDNLLCQRSRIAAGADVNGAQWFVILQSRHEVKSYRILPWILVLPVFGYAHDFNEWTARAVGAEPFPQWILIRPIASGQGLIYDCHLRRLLRVVVIELPPADDRNAHGGEIFWINAVIKDVLHRVLVLHVRSFHKERVRGAVVAHGN